MKKSVILIAVMFLLTAVSWGQTLSSGFALFVQSDVQNVSEQVVPDPTNPFNAVYKFSMTRVTGQTTGYTGWFKNYPLFSGISQIRFTAKGEEIQPVTRVAFRFLGPNVGDTATTSYTLISNTAWLQYPATLNRSVSFTRMEIYLSFPQSEWGTSIVYFDNIEVFNGINWIVIDPGNGNSPGIPTNLLPINGANVGLPFYISWTMPVGATVAHLQIDNTSSFDPPLEYDNANITGNIVLITNLPAGIHYWHVRVKGVNGIWGPWSPTMYFYVTLTGIEPISGDIPKEYKLKQNYPNPFNPVTSIEFALAKSQFVNLIIYDAAGRAVKTLVNEMKAPGFYKVDFNASELSSGVYFYRIETNDYTATRKMTLVK